MVLVWAQRIIGLRCFNCGNEWGPYEDGRRRCSRCRAEAIEPVLGEWGWF